MKKVYLLVYSNDLGTRQEVKDAIDLMPEISHWRYDLPNCFYLLSESSADEIAKLIRAKLGNKRFLITEITSNRQGWLPQKSWDVINKKKE